GNMFDKAFNVAGVIPNNEAIVAAAQSKFGTSTALIMVFGMIANILLAKVTRFKYIFLTGHHTLFMACLIAATLSIGGLQGVPLVLIGSI
ncbi:PTS ascorbate transporter subunit IIC, partial [Escherichia coli]|nr:PTS ascorbate transporter subunit IIC [Escherichia coli]